MIALPWFVGMWHDRDLGVDLALIGQPLSIVRVVVTHVGTAVSFVGEMLTHVRSLVPMVCALVPMVCALVPMVCALVTHIRPLVGDVCLRLPLGQGGVAVDEHGRLGRLPVDLGLLETPAVIFVRTGRHTCTVARRAVDGHGRCRGPGPRHRRFS
jgi:hypothetical protein